MSNNNDNVTHPQSDIDTQNDVLTPNDNAGVSDAASIAPDTESNTNTVDFSDGMHTISFFGEMEDDITANAEVFPAPAPAVMPSSDDSQISFFEEATPQPAAVCEKIPPFLPKEPKSGKIVRKKVYDKEHPRTSDAVFDFIELFIISLLAVLLITSFFFRHSMVEGDSMMNTLQNGDHLIISDFMYEPKVGDIIIVHSEHTEERVLVKRIIGVGGDRIRTDTDGKVWRNGKLLDESDYVYISDRYGYMPAVDIVVPEGEVFVMGDHRNNSNDSRSFGTIKEDAIIGKVLLRIFPIESFGRVD